MANSYEIDINGITYFKSEKKLYDLFEVVNSYDITDSVVDNTIYDEQKPEWIIYRQIISSSIDSETYDSIITNEIVKKSYLDSYSSTIQQFILAAKQSVYLRPLAVTGSASTGSTVTGADLFNQSPFYDLVDIQQLKELSSNIFATDPCLLMDSENATATVEPIKVALLKTNFRLLCRTIITTLKLQSVFLCSVFNNEEFYKSGAYYDSTFVDYAFEILKQKLDLLIPKYKKSIQVFLQVELDKKISNGEEIVDPITNKKVVIDTPLSDDNFSTNMLRYMNIIFKEELIFISDKTNTLFNVSGSDPVSSAPYSFAPTSTFGTNKLFTAKEYFIDSLPVVTYLDTTFSSAYANSRIYLELSASKDLENNKITTFLKLKNKVNYFEENYISIVLSDVQQQNNLDRDLSDDELIEFMNNRLASLKQKLLTNDTFLLITNYIFPVNKILNIASLFHINMSLRLYENLNDITKGSIKTVSTIHNTISDKNQDCDTPSPIDFNLDDMIMGVNLEILKAIALAPIKILKGIEETFDPNIFIASKIRTLAETVGAPKLPIIPYSAPLMIPPPYGPGILPIIPFGFYYWAVDAVELALSYAKDGFQTNSIPSFNISKDPFKPDC